MEITIHLASRHINLTARKLIILSVWYLKFKKVYNSCYIAYLMPSVVCALTRMLMGGVTALRVYTAQGDPVIRQCLV